MQGEMARAGLGHHYLSLTLSFTITFVFRWPISTRRRRLMCLCDSSDYSLVHTTVTNLQQSPACPEVASIVFLN